MRVEFGFKSRIRQGGKKVELAFGQKLQFCHFLIAPDIFQTLHSYSTKTVLWPLYSTKTIYIYYSTKNKVWPNDH